MARSTLIDATLTGTAKTFNGAPTNPTSMDACVDLFFIAGASRRMSENDIVAMFSKAYAEDALTATRIAFWARDIRGGAGERRFFKIVCNWLEKKCSTILDKNISLIPEFGRWKDIFDLNPDVILPLIKEKLEDKTCQGLLSKWLPRQGKFANQVRKFLGLTPKEYRKLLVKLSSTVEQKMCAKDWKDIKYETVPSIAMNKYRTAFFKNDSDRFKMYIDAVTKGDSKMNASVLFPHDLVYALRRGDNEKAVDAQWKSLPNFVNDSTENLMVMADVSGSMQQSIGNKTRVEAIDVSIALAIYLSERSRGIFQDAFITFTQNPTMQYLKGSLSDKLRQVSGPIGFSTDLQKAFEFILNQAKTHDVPAQDMPTKILIISDMEFDNSHVRKPDAIAMDMIEENYIQSGYNLPEIIFWNVAGRKGNVPTKAVMKNTALVSGYSAAIVSQIIKGKIDTPIELMLRTVHSERYQPVQV